MRQCGGLFDSLVRPLLHMETIVNEIERAIATLQLSSGAIERLPLEQSEAVRLSVLGHFVASGDRRWWWEAFRNPGASAKFENGDGWARLPAIVPNPNESVWFIAEEVQLSHYPVFETTVAIASQVISECYGFEYYLVAKNLSWLVCENHHNRVFAVGSAVESRLLQNAA
jgi:hypothetical protein